MTRVFLMLLAMIAATPALALSCMAPTVEQVYMDAHESEFAFVPVLGHFEGFVTRPPGSSPSPRDRQFTARFVGHYYTAKGKGSEIVFPVSVTETCVASWCGALPQGNVVLTFLRKDGNDYAFTIGACGGSAFISPTRAELKAMRTCLRKNSC